MNSFSVFQDASSGRVWVGSTKDPEKKFTALKKGAPDLFHLGNFPNLPPKTWKRLQLTKIVDNWYSLSREEIGQLLAELDRARELHPKRVATGKKSKRKGNSAERAVAKIFTDWWKEDFVRTPQSGGWGKHKSYQDKFGTSGDLVCPAGFPFCIESKSAEGWNLEQLLTSPEKCQIVKYWEQAVGETTEGRIPLLVFTRNYQPWFVMLPGGSPFQSEIRELALEQGMPYLCLSTKKHYTLITLLTTLTLIPKARILELISAQSQ